MYTEKPAGWKCEYCHIKVIYTDKLYNDEIPIHLQIGMEVIGTICKLCEPEVKDIIKYRLFKV